MSAHPLQPIGGSDLAPIRIGTIGCVNVLSAYRTTIRDLRESGAAIATKTCGRAALRHEAERTLEPAS